MNSNRTKYASTPTYGMQKRNFAKKQAAAQPAPTPDFTQQPATEVNTPIAPFPAQNPFVAPQSAYSGAPAAQPGFFQYSQYGGGAPLQPGSMPAGGAPLQSGGMPAGGYGGFMPRQPAAAPAYGRPLGNAVPSADQNSFSPRTQGFVPPSFPQENGAAPQAAAGSPVMGAAPQQAGIPMGVNGGLNAPYTGPNPAGGLYANAGFAAGGMANGGMANGGMANGGMANAGMPNGGMANGGMANAGMANGGLPPYGNAPYRQTAMNFAGNGNADAFPSQPYPGKPGGTPARPTPRQPFDMDKWLKIFLYGVLPVLFIPCVFVTHTYDFLRYAFIILAVIALSVLWYRQSFSSGLRTTLSVGYLALSIIVIALLVGNTNDVTRTSGSNLSANNAVQTTATPEVTEDAAALAAEETPAPVEDEGQSEAEQRLITFMDYWSVNNYEQMVNLVQPSWASAQDGAAQALFTLISNRTPLNYTIESISGTAGDSSRTITMSADIDKNNGKDPVRYRFMILMVNEGDEWYVDPKSLATNETVEEEEAEEDTTQTLAPRMTVTPVPAADTKLYYNADGGKYYHIDPECSAVNKKYLPMTSFLYSELDDPPYSSLEPCLKCGAPTESLGDLEADTTTTP